MADFCNTCYADFEYDNLAREWFVENPKTVDSERLFLRKIYGFDEIPKTTQSQWKTMICEGCSRKGTLICIVDDGGYCIDPNCDKHAELNKIKGWYEIDGTTEVIGEIRNTNWLK